MDFTMNDEIAGKLAEFEVLSKSMKQKKQEIKKAIFYAKHPQLRMAKEEVEASKVKESVKEPTIKDAAKEPTIKDAVKEPTIKDAAEIFNRVLKEETEKPTIKVEAVSLPVKESVKETIKEATEKPVKIPEKAPPQHVKAGPLIVPLGGKWF
jgi:hypothetical protein